MKKTKMKNISLKEYIKNKFKTEEEKEGLEKERLLAHIALSIAELRERQGLSQVELARLLHTRQQYISRIEQPENDSITLNTLNKVAEIFHKKLIVEFV